MDQEVAKTLGELEIKLQELERELTSIGRRDAQPNKLQAQGKLVDEAVEGDGDAPAAAGQYADTGANAGSNPGTVIANAWQQTAAETASGQQHYAGGTGVGLDDEQARAVDNAFGGPAVFGGEELPAQPAIETRPAFPVSETAYGEIASDSPQPPTASFPSGVFSPATAETPGTPQPGPPLPPPGPPLPPPGQPPVPHTPTPQPPPPQPIDRAELVRFKEKLQRTMEELVDEYGKLLLPKPPA
ncbi:MAG TPA: hypothetical protein VGP18_00925 [Solirubrobacteraceae bacterium]|jgi:hypothetical protein|nr:hypothetical protein [Solirubrobacteraceae bacterium]